MSGWTKSNTVIINNVQNDVETIDSKIDVIDINLDDALNEVEIIEHHLHAKSRVFGISADQSGNNWATEDRLAAFIAISGNGDFGSDPNDEAKVFGTADTPFITGQTYFDTGAITVTNVSNDNVYIIRIVWGTGTMADAVLAGQYSEKAFKFDSTNPQLTSNEQIDIGMPPIPVGTKVWVQVKNGTDNATLNFLVDVHGYTI